MTKEQIRKILDDFNFNETFQRGLIAKNPDANYSAIEWAEKEYEKLIDNLSQLLTPSRDIIEVYKEWRKTHATCWSVANFLCDLIGEEEVRKLEPTVPKDCTPSQVDVESIKDEYFRVWVDGVTDLEKRGGCKIIWPWIEHKLTHPTMDSGEVLEGFITFLVNKNPTKSEFNLKVLESIKDEYLQSKGGK